MLIRSFTGPIAIALCGCVLSIGVMASGVRVMSFVLAPAMVTSVITMGTTTLADAPSLSAAVVAPYLVVSAVMVGLATLCGGLYLRRRDIAA